MKYLIPLLGLLTFACGGHKAQLAESRPAKTMTMVEINYTPALRTACPNVSLEAPKFAYDSSELSSDANKEMAELARCLEKPEMANSSVVLVGRADPRGTKDYNRDLGRDRAEAISKVLTAHGLAAGRVRVLSAGEKAASAVPWNWPKDRRVDVGVRGDGEFSVDTVDIAYIPPTGPVVFREREDIDGDGVQEPALYPAKLSATKAGSSFKEVGDPDADGVQEPSR